MITTAIYGIKGNKCLQQIPEVKESGTIVITDILPGKYSESTVGVKGCKPTDHVIITLRGVYNLPLIKVTTAVYDGSIHVVVFNEGTSKISDLNLNVLVLGYAD